MRILIRTEVFRKFNPKLKVAFLVVKGMDNRSKLNEAKHLLQEVEKLVQLTFNQDSLKTHHLIQPWAVARAEFGAMARHYHTSVEKLLQTVLKKKSVAVEDTLTCLLRYLALKHIIPFGVDDLHQVKGSLTFAISSGKEKSRLLKGLEASALYYADDGGALGQKLDYWKNRRTALSKKSTSALVHFPALPPITLPQLAKIVKEADELIRTFCGGKIKVFVLDKQKNYLTF